MTWEDVNRLELPLEPIDDVEREWVRIEVAENLEKNSKELWSPRGSWEKWRKRQSSKEGSTHESLRDLSELRVAACEVVSREFERFKDLEFDARCYEGLQIPTPCGHCPICRSLNRPRVVDFDRRTFAGFALEYEAPSVPDKLLIGSDKRVVTIWAPREKFYEVICTLMTGKFVQHVIAPDEIKVNPDLHQFIDCDSGFISCTPVLPSLFVASDGILDDHFKAYCLLNPDVPIYILVPNGVDEDVFERDYLIKESRRVTWHEWRKENEQA